MLSLKWTCIIKLRSNRSSPMRCRLKTLSPSMTSSFYVVARLTRQPSASSLTTTLTIKMMTSSCSPRSSKCRPIPPLPASMVQQVCPLNSNNKLPSLMHLIVRIPLTIQNLLSLHRRGKNSLHSISSRKCAQLTGSIVDWATTKRSIIHHLLQKITHR